MYNVTFDTSGPMWDGRAEKAVDDFVDEAVWEITKEGRGDLGVQFIKVFQHPTGYYESQVHAVRPHLHTAYIRDGGVIYSHWLEGIGSRNYPVTRFKGYFSFKVISQALQRKAVAIAERHLPRFIQRMNGGV